METVLSYPVVYSERGQVAGNCPVCSCTGAYATQARGVSACTRCGCLYGFADTSTYRKIVSGRWSTQETFDDSVHFDITVVGLGRRHGIIDARGDILQTG